MPQGVSAQKRSQSSQGCQAPGLGLAGRVNAVCLLVQKYKSFSMFAICVCVCKVPGKREFCKENLILDHTHELLVGGTQEKPLYEAEKLLEGRQTHPSHLPGEVPILRYADGQPPGPQEKLPTLLASPGPRPAPQDTSCQAALRGPARDLIPLPPASAELGRDPGPGCLLKASSQGNSQLTWPAVCGPAVPARSWKYKQTFLCSDSKVKYRAAWRPAVNFSAHALLREQR